jgi:hypothetical protein
MSLAIGFVLGMINSLVSWWAVARYLGPKMAISSCITIVPTNIHSRGQLQRFKVMNRRRWRGLAEVRAVARLRIQGLPAAQLVYPNSRLGFEISLSSIDSCVDFIGPRESWIFTLDPRKITSPYVVFLPKSVRRSVESHTCTISDLLELGTSAELEVFVSATDAYSGSRRTIAKKYDITDVIEGYFKIGSLETTLEEALGH